LSVGLVVVAIGLASSSGLAAEPTAKKQKTTNAKPSNAKARSSKTATNPSPPRTAQAPLDPRVEQERQTVERVRLTERIAELHKQIAAGERSRAGAASALQRAERELATVNARLRVLDERRRGVEERAATLDRQRASRESELGTRRRQYVATVVETAANRATDPLHLVLTGRDPMTPLVVDTALDYSARAQTDEIRQLRLQVTDLQTQRKAGDDEQAALVEQARAQRSAQDTLMSDRVAQRDALAKLSSQLADQRRSASALEADEKRLTRVVEELQRAIDRRAAEERVRREAARKREEAQKREEARKARPDASTPSRPTPRRPEPEPEPPVAATGAFGRLRGSLPLPTRGTVAARFGAPRGDSGASWKGLFIKTADGAEVRAIAAGQVVFADYLRGFGNLVIIDHGDQYLSIYGNNEAVVKKAGDRVSAGEVVARAGNSSGDDQTGLYFELRFRGRPFDPTGWIGAR
jgi:septal ring factor EnvC (AmiA/AmiB activator)